MFALAYMGRKRIFQMLSLHASGLLPLAAVLCTCSKALEGLRPVFVGPWSRISCTRRHQRMRVRLSLRKAA